MEAKGPASDVFALIDNLEHEVHEEQANHDKLRAQQQQQCDQEINFRKGEIAEAQQAQSVSAAHQAKCESSRDNDVANIEINIQNQENTKDKIAKLIAKRQDEAAAYARRSTQHKESLDVIRVAEEYLDQLVTGAASLAQIAHSSTKLIKKSIEMRHVSAFAPAVVAFNQLAMSADPQTYYDSDAVERVRALFNKVRDEINSAFDAYTQAEQAAIDAFKKQKAELEGHLADLIADEKTLRRHLAEMNACVNQEIEIQKEAKAKEERNAGLLGDATSLCAHQEAQYHKATEARTDELKVLAELRRIVEKRYKEFSAHVAHRADADQFAAHNNTSEYQDDAYVKNGGKFNAGGAEQSGFKRDKELERFL